MTETLYGTLQADFKTAFKERKDIEKGILNYVLAQVKNKMIDTRQDLTDEEVQQILKKEVKALQEAAEYLEKAGNAE